MKRLGYIYYFPSLPIDLLNLIGKFAGDTNREIVFTLTQKRKYLGNIFVQAPYRKYLLQTESWIPSRLGDRSDADLFATYMRNQIKHSGVFIPTDRWYLRDFAKLMSEFTSQLTSIRNYRLE